MHTRSYRARRRDRVLRQSNRYAGEVLHGDLPQWLEWRNQRPRTELEWCHVGCIRLHRWWRGLVPTTRAKLVHFSVSVDTLRSAQLRPSGRHDLEVWSDID